MACSVGQQCQWACGKAFLPCRRLNPLRDGTRFGKACGALHRLNEPCCLLPEGMAQNKDAAHHIVVTSDEFRRG